jgi:hypothetical protein
VQSASRVIGAIGNSVRDPGGIIQQRLGELEVEAARLREAGERLKPDNPVMRALLADLDVVMGRNASRLDAGADDVQAAAVRVSGETTRQLALPGMGEGQVRIAVNEAWSSADPEVVQRLVGYVDNPAWVDEVSQYGARVVATVENQAIAGMARGWSSVKAAREIRRVTEALPQHVANVLMRTLYMESYRSGTALNQNANVSLIRRVIRVESLDRRICAACVYLHGEVIWDAERNAGEPIPKIQEHHQGRGTTITEVRGMTRDIGRGEDWFNGLSDARQREILRNDSAHRALKDGAVRLQDFVKEYNDPVFGDMVRQASLVDMLGDGAGKWK